MVHRNHVHLDAVTLAQAGGHVLQLRLAAGGDDQIEAVGGEHVGEGGADAGRGAGHERGTSGTHGFMIAFGRMSRLALLGLSVAVLAGVTAAQPARPQPTTAPFTVVEATIAEMRTAMERGRTTSRAIVQQSLDRIAATKAASTPSITVNPRALDDAAARDEERRRGRVRGPLHGIPIALKDNIHTTDMPTTGGALAFAALVPPYEATLTTRLRAAGAVIVAKTVLTELANWVASDMPTNYSSLAGFGFNPYDPRPDPRPGSDGRPVLPPGGSSSGIGTAASFWAANVGTETSGSILNPASRTMLVGIKPTVGRISRYGVIPITADQDTPGPMARTVADAATLLGVLEGDAPDPHDPATRACTPPPRHDYTAFLRPGALKGARIGVPRAFFYDAVQMPGARGTSGGLARTGARGDERGHRRAEAGGCHHRGPGRPALGARAGRRAPRRLAGVQRARRREGARQPLLHRVQVRHEARLQCLAGLARRRGAGEEPHRAARVEPGPREPRAR